MGLTRKLWAATVAAAVLVAGSSIAAGAADVAPPPPTVPADATGLAPLASLGDERPAPDPLPVDVRQAPQLPRPTKAAGAPTSSALAAPMTRSGATTRIVEVRHDGAADSVSALVADLGGRVHGPAGPRALEATVPAAAVAALEAGPHVEVVTTPTLVSPTAGEAGTALLGQEVALTSASTWHANGFRGAGVKVGIIDTFSAGSWAVARAAGDVPAPSGTFCRAGGSACDLWSVNSRHGVGVAEIVHEMAPQAQLYLATVVTAADLQAAIDYFAAQGVRVVTRSETAEYDGPGNGTGPLADVVASAVAKGMLYLNAAGNSAGGGGRAGSYWRSGWSDADGDGFLNFNGADEMLRTRCWFFNGLRWDDWGSGRTDYDVHLFDATGTVYLGGSLDAQLEGALPLERLNDLPCELGEEVNIAIELYAPGASGTAGDVLEIMVNSVGLEYWQNPGSAGGPMSDSASPGALSIGAIDPPAGGVIAAYSSQGPLNDGRTKPDLSAPACVTSTAYAPDCFNGTSAATPVVAGAAALVIGAGRASGPAAVATFLRDATVDRGAVGTDHVYGRGQLVLPTRPVPAPFASWGSFVDRQFRDLLGRAPTAAERSTWVGRLLTGSHVRADLVAGLRTSSASTTYVDPAARLYWAYFLRIPDRTGLQYWITQRRDGMSLARMSHGFASSQEFRQRYGTLSDRAFVERIYLNILGRPGESSGVTYWTGELTSGRRTRGSVMLGFSEAAEYRTKRRVHVDVAVIAVSLLRRSPTTAELDAHVLAGSSTKAIAEWAFTRPEYPPPT